MNKLRYYHPVTGERRAIKTDLSCEDALKEEAKTLELPEDFFIIDYTFGEITGNEIDMEILDTSDIGRWVEYHAVGGKPAEPGRIKNFTEHVVFVVYHCSGNWDKYQDYTGVATSPSDLVFINEPEVKPDVAGQVAEEIIVP